MERILLLRLLRWHYLRLGPMRVELALACIPVNLWRKRLLSENTLRAFSGSSAMLLVHIASDSYTAPDLYNALLSR